MVKLSVVIITHNEEERISRCLNSVKSLADEIVVVDSHSSDRTADICREFGCRVILHRFEGYGQQKQFAVEQAANDWILSLDADEELSEDLSSEIRLLLEKTKALSSGYLITISLFYMGKILKHFNVVRIRLFNRKHGHFTTVPVHEGVVLDGEPERLKGIAIHNSYHNLSHHLQKINIYTTQAAEKNVSEKRSYSKFWVAFKFPATFFTYYFFRLGFLDGYPGFLWSFFAAFYGSLKIAKTIEKDKTL